MTATATQLEIDRDKGDFKYEESHKYDAGVGLDEGTIDYICDEKEKTIGYGTFGSGP